MFSFFNYRWEAIIIRCCDFLLRTLRTRVLDFSGLKKASEYVDTVQMLNERISTKALTVCIWCPGFVHDYCRNDHVDIYDAFYLDEDELGYHPSSL